MLLIREHPFNLKGFFGENFFLSLKWTGIFFLLALCALKNIVYVERKKCRDNLSRKKNLLRCEAKQNILTPKKTIAPPPFKLNGCSLTNKYNMLTFNIIIWKNCL